MEKTNKKNGKLNDKSNIAIVIMSLILVGLLIGTSYLGWLYKHGDKNAVIIYYVGYETPYFEYRLEKEGWCTPPGTPLEKNSDKGFESYTHKIIIPLDNSTKVIGKFNDSKGNTDDNCGQYYEFTKGIYLYDNGNLVRYDQVGDFAITSFKPDKMAVKVGDAVTLKVKTMGGKAPITYKFSIINEQKKETVVQDFSSNDVTQITAKKPGEYTFVVVAKDETGLTQSKKIEGFQVTSLGISEINTNVPSPQNLGTKIELSMKIDNSAGIELNCTYEIKKDSGGDPVSLQASKDGTAIWEPKESGEYKIVGRIEGGDFKAEKEINYTINEESQQQETKLTIFYSGINDPYFYYRAVGNDGAEFERVQMEQDSTMPGYSYKVEFNVSYTNRIVGFFSDSNGGSVDNNNGQNYEFTTGYIGVKNGQLKNIGAGVDEEYEDNGDNGDGGNNANNGSVVKIYSADKKRKYVNYEINGQWQQAPGKEMQKIDEDDYKYYIEIPLQGQQSIKVTFNKEYMLFNNSKVFTLGAGTYYYKNDEIRNER